MLTALHQRSLNVNGASPSSPIDPNNDLVHFCHVAALVLTIYDHVISLDNEVEYIWSKSWSKSKFLYVLARYFGDILLIFLEPRCFTFGAIGLKFVGTGSMVTIIITQMIMQSRIKALYGKIVSTLITVFWVMEVIAVLSLGIASLAAIDVHPVSLDSDTIRMCNPTYLPRYAFLFWVPVLVFESFLFLLALRIAYQNYREIGTWRGASLIYIILRDNFSFFICAFVAYLVTATTWLTANPQYFTVPGAFSCSLTTIMGCRLIFNLCEAYHHPPDPDATLPASIWAAATSGGVFFVNPHARSESESESQAFSQDGAGSRSRGKEVSWGGRTGEERGRGGGRGKGRRRGVEDSLQFASFDTKTSGSKVWKSVGTMSVGVLSSEGKEHEGLRTEEHEMRDLPVSVVEAAEEVEEEGVKTLRLGDEEEGMDDSKTVVHP